MAHYETWKGKTDDYYTPEHVFTALDCGTFDMDVAAAQDPRKAFVKAYRYISLGGLESEWHGFVWCNPPYGMRGSKMPWIKKVAEHGDGLLLMPDRTSADWWQEAARRCTSLLVVYNKLQFVSPEGHVFKQPSTGNTIFAFGGRALSAIRNAQKNNLGMLIRA
ncbi:MAG TPA: DNA N-6-adenine-methyltransferase [Puia sp.]|nr:DNA N-6-adenine-methyltransferase [Puia sp.]